MTPIAKVDEEMKMRNLYKRKKDKQEGKEKEEEEEEGG